MTGVQTCALPIWAVLPEKDRWNLVAYIKSFAADKFKEAPKKLELPKEVASSAESIKRGKEMFEAIECNKCHGADGRADGPSRAELKDEWGHPIAPANLTKRWTFRGGASRTDIAMLQEAYLFWRIAKGGPGLPKESTPWNSVMPAWEDRLSEEQILQVIMYLYDATDQQPRRWEASH